MGITARATDADTHDTISYSFGFDAENAPILHDTRFAIDPTTGEVTVYDGLKIDYESATGHAYDLTVYASDGTTTSQKTFSIGVTNAGPAVASDSNIAANTVAEGAALGASTGLTASSTDLGGGTVTYSFGFDAENAPILHDTRFAIDPTTGEVTVYDGLKIDYESATGHAYDLTVYASDGTTTSQKTFSIGVDERRSGCRVGQQHRREHGRRGSGPGSLDGPDGVFDRPGRRDGHVQLRL